MKKGPHFWEPFCTSLALETRARGPFLSRGFPQRHLPLFEALLFFPLPSSFLGCLGSHLLYVAFRPFLLVFLFSALKIIGYSTMLDLVPDFEVILECVAFSHCLSPVSKAVIQMGGLYHWFPSFPNRPNVNSNSS